MFVIAIVWPSAMVGLVKLVSLTKSRYTREHVKTTASMTTDGGRCKQEDWYCESSWVQSGSRDTELNDGSSREHML